MAQTIATFDTAHNGPLHDAQLDYYGKRLATCSSDHLIRLWDVSTAAPQFLSELGGHEAPVWQVSWAHPQFGNVLASCSYDRRILVWKDVGVAPDSWKVIYKNESHCSSVNSIAFCPWEYGLQLAAGSSDGSISVMSHCPDHTWYRKAFFAHPHGVNAVSWSPAAQAAVATQHNSLNDSDGLSADLRPPRLASCGCDNLVRIWMLDSNSNEWVEEASLGLPERDSKEGVPTAGEDDSVDSKKAVECTGHTQWVRDVSWRPSVGLPSHIIASCSDDKRVILWAQESEGATWYIAQVLDFSERVWRVSWSVTGSILAVANGDAQVTLFKETLDGRWERLIAPSVTDHAQPEGWPWALFNQTEENATSVNR